MINHTPLSFLQINTNRSTPVMETALEIAVSKGVDIVLVQEPPVITQDSGYRCLNHPTFHQVGPTVTSPQRPRVWTYIRRGIQNYEINALTSSDPDYMFLTVQDDQVTWTILNIYNQAPQEQSAPGWTIERLNNRQLRGEM